MGNPAVVGNPAVSRGHGAQRADLVMGVTTTSACRRSQGGALARRKDLRLVGGRDRDPVAVRRAEPVFVADPESG